MSFLKFFLGHEAYVLTPEQIAEEHAKHSFNVLSPLTEPHNLILFALIGGAITASLVLALWLKTTAFFKNLGDYINRATIIAPDVVRVTFGASLIASSTHHSLFGPEIPLSSLPHPALIEPLLFILGVMAILGVFTRVIATAAAAIWVGAFVDQGAYLFTYSNYLGEALALIMMPQQLLTLDHLFSRNRKPHEHKIQRSSRWGMPIARILFAFALLYTAVSVKIIYPAEPLQVVNQYHLTQFFPFEPGFVVLGAALTEILIGTLYLLGLLRRVTTVVFITFIVLSLLYFQEAVWPHYLLLGLGLGIFLHKPDDLALDYLLFKPKTKKPAPKRAAKTA